MTREKARVHRPGPLAETFDALPDAGASRRVGSVAHAVTPDYADDFEQTLARIRAIHAETWLTIRETQAILDRMKRPSRPGFLRRLFRARLERTQE